MEEILMIPPLQKHFAILPASNVSKKNLDSKFLFNKDVSSKFVCDIVDSDEMEKLQIPAHLLDVVRDHTTGLNPEEQMLIRKCALLGNNFGLFVLEAVCPEYPTAELRYKIRNLLKKNLLKLQCQHLGITEKRGRETITLREIPTEFCIHPIRFYCDYLKKSVLNVMPESQRQRLNLYLADLLMATPRCDSCKNEWQKRRHSSLPAVSRHFHVPWVDMRMCQCLELKTHFALQVEYHLEKGNGLIGDRIEMLLEAAEFGVLTRSPNMVDRILIKTKRLLVEGGLTAQIEIDPTTVAIVRLKAQVNLLYGKNNEAMREIKHALLLLNVLFPSDIERKVNRQIW
ncbi:hypothetical protein AVEN_19582-1 [Araneus ventricosus]|uniref:Uncharacterized protein n=1 Tax=Araneus ventricosus TaxID=182803 RepID=A0A4Y2V641_ARAVE|nr:hypothetical protein AVEN_19582-1 [Araneus ventricosus]